MQLAMESVYNIQPVVVIHHYTIHHIIYNNTLYYTPYKTIPFCTQQYYTIIYQFSLDWQVLSQYGWGSSDDTLVHQGSHLLQPLLSSTNLLVTGKGISPLQNRQLKVSLELSGWTCQQCICMCTIYICGTPVHCIRIALVKTKHAITLIKTWHILSQNGLIFHFMCRNTKFWQNREL